MSAWFGEPWPDGREPASVCEDPGNRVPTPIGALCLHCREEIIEGDRGVLSPAVEMAGDGILMVKTLPIHIECLLRMTLGGPAHLLGRCSCTGGDCDPDMGLSPRESARLVWSAQHGGLQ